MTFSDTEMKELGRSTWNIKTRVNTDKTKLERPSLVKAPLLVLCSLPIFIAFVLRQNGCRG